MSKIDPLIRIFWLSDIHYDDSKYLNKNESLKKYLETFIKYAKKITSKKYDYFLISGDIAQSGKYEDYSLFFDDILSPLKNSFEKSNLLVIPGNHDVNQKNELFNKLFIQNLSKGSDKASFLREKKESFFENFKNYTDFNKKIEAEFINTPTINSTLKKNSFLYGHSIDIKKKVIFIMLNSCWFSVEDSLMTKYIKKNINKSTLKTATELANDISNISSEYSNQALCLSEIDEIDVILRLLKKYSDYLVITIMHHPINWLTWSERIKNDRNIFHSIRQNTDLLLTGHEHVPKIHLSEYMENESLLHIQAGCFMTHPHKAEKFNVNNNWFSTLEINTLKRTVKQIKHFYVEDKNIWQSQKSKIKKLNKKYDSKLSKEREKSIIDKFNLETYLNNLKPKSKIDKKENNYYFIDGILYIFIFKNYTLKDLGINLSTFNELINKTANNKVYFYFFDFYHKKFSAYSSNKDKLVVLYYIKNDFDDKFNKFRADFFKKLNLDNAMKYCKLSFINIIKPYWVTEKYI